LPTRSPSLAALGRAVRDIRTKKGLTQAELGERSGQQPTYISDIERGVRNPSYESLVELASALGVKLGDIIRAAERRQ